MRHRVRDYTFNAAARQITLLDDLSDLHLEDFVLVTHIPTGNTLYNFTDGALGGTLAGNVLTLDYDTTAYNNADPIQIFIDVQDPDMNALMALLGDGLSEVVRQLQAIRNDGGMPDASGRVRVNVETGGTLGAVTSLNQFAGYSNILYVMTQTNAGAQALRNKITIS